MGTSVEPQPVAPNPPGGAKLVESSFLAQENQLLTIVQQYMAPAEVEQVSLAFQLAQETCKDVHVSLSPTSIPQPGHALTVGCWRGSASHVRLYRSPEQAGRPGRPVRPRPQPCAVGPL